MVKARQNVLRDKEAYAKITKDRINELETDLQLKNTEFNK